MFLIGKFAFYTWFSKERILAGGHFESSPSPSYI
jgi:hypothetical protein